jgi:hypothetical protein
MKYLKYFDKNKEYSDKKLKTLTTLNLPNIWDDSFICSDNNLKNLIGSPKYVSNAFWCDYNELTSLEGAPIKVGENFYCHHNNLKNLIGFPEKFFGEVDCSNNYLTSLIGLPNKIYGDFYCNNNQLTSLDFCPEISGFSKYLNNPWTNVIPYDLIKKFNIQISDLYTKEQKEKFGSYEYQKEYLTNSPEKYKDLEPIGFNDKIKDEFDWLFNAIDMGLM